MNAWLAGRDLYENPMSIEVPFIILNSTADRQKILEIFTEKILRPAKNDGECLYPEMKQKIIKRFGYYFWCENEKFDLEDHIKYANETDPDAPMTKSDIQDFISSKLVSTPFSPSRSPWLIYIVRNFNDSGIPDGKSALIFIFHHCLCDGFSIANLLQNLSTNSGKEFVGTPKSSESTTTWKNNLLSLLLLLTGPYHIIKDVSFMNDSSSPTKFSFQKLSGQWNVHETSLVPMQTLKDITHQFNVSLSSVLFTIVSEGIRRTLKNRNVVMSKLHICSPFLLPGHPDSLTNYWSTAKIPVLFHNEGFEKTLESVCTAYRNLQRSLSPASMWHFYTLVGLLPISLHPDSSIFSRCILIVSNFPGPSHAVDVFGYEQIQFGITGKPMPGYQFWAGIQSYRGYFRIILAGDSSILKGKSDAIELANAVEDVLNQCGN